MNPAPANPTISPMPRLAPVALATSKPVGLNIGGFVTWAQSGHLAPTGEVTRQRGQINSRHFPHRRLVSTLGSRGQCLINVFGHGLDFARLVFWRPYVLGRRVIHSSLEATSRSNSRRFQSSCLSGKPCELLRVFEFDMRRFITVIIKNPRQKNVTSGATFVVDAK